MQHKEFSLDEELSDVVFCGCDYYDLYALN